ncbi:MAG TPA: magnesium transporter [Candidatus Acetothermia bacterium]|nr:magnesium transporter [Candidatus Acetothermia bacterium]HEX32431.1 magnesium transporter [Candidatus Acetothermia bacterium]
MEKKVLLRDLLLKHPADVAEVLSQLSDEKATELLHRLFLRQAAAEPLGEMEPEDSAELLSEIDRDEAIKILSRMDPDDAVDVLDELPDDVQEELLSRLGKEDAQVLSNLLTYPPDTAGGLMSPEVVALPLDMTAQEAIDFLRKKVEEVETIYYAYAVDEEGHLQGVFSLRDMALAQPNTRLSNLLKKDAISVPVDADAEDVAHLFDKYNYYALPVVDKDKKLLGVITIDDVIDVMREEATEDIYLSQGVPLEERVDTPWYESIKSRMPWLYFNLFTAFLAASVVGAFESTIAKFAVLAFFMPIIAGQGGNAGMQTVTIVTRGIALGEVPKGEGWHILRKELLLGLLNGLAMGIVVGAVGFIWKRAISLGLVVFLAMMFNMITAGIVGTIIPLGLRAIRQDPALASSIFLTTFTDTLGFAFLFLLARILIPGVR